VAKPVMRRRWRKKRTGFGAAVGFLREYEQKKTGTARGSVTVNHDAVGSSPTGGAIQALLWQCFFVAQNTLNTELRSRWQRLRSAAGGGRSKQGLVQRSAFCENTSRKRREPQEEA